ncbi:MAG: hypothetical protein EPN23_00650, partial [Verrucomicrobia bacterium]
RIDEIRGAYRSNQSGSSPAPNIVLVAHSMGGLLSHYYLCKCAEAHQDSGVRRLVTLGSPHQGSLFANWVMYKQAHPLNSIFAGMSWRLWQPILQQVGGGLSGLTGGTAGFSMYEARGAVEDISRVDPQAPSRLMEQHNDLMDYFKHHGVPGLEYVFNVYKAPWSSPSAAGLRLGSDSALDDEVRQGDGVVAQFSAAGKRSQSDPSIWQYRDPVIFGPWNAFHSDEPTHTESILKSLFGVPYQWPESVADSLIGMVQPDYAKMYGENQSFGKLPWGYSIGVPSDEPGIRDLILLCASDAHPNPLVIDALNTWGQQDYNAVPQNLYTDRVDLVGHQIIGDASAHLRVLGLVGAKNRAEEPLGAAGYDEATYDNLFHWAKDGNEYLPASLYLKLNYSSTPDYNAVPAFGFQKGLITKCMAMLDTNGVPQYQYGLFDQTFNNITLAQSSDPIYFFARGMNLAELNTPITERGFEVPLKAADLKWVMCAINEREQAAGLEPTHWTQWVTEWIDLPADATSFALNFPPTQSSGCQVADAFMRAVSNYATASQTLSVPSADAPRCLKVTYTAVLDTNSLAGLPLNANLIGQLQGACERLIPHYADHTKASNGEFVNVTDIPMWNMALNYDDYPVITPADGNIFVDAIDPQATSWRRKGPTDSDFQYGGMQPGDYIGPWCCEDLKKVLLLLRWPVFPCDWKSKDENNSRLGGSDYVVDDATWSAAKARAENEYNNVYFNPFSNDGAPCVYSEGEQWFYDYPYFSQGRADLYRGYAYAILQKKPVLAKPVSADLYFSCRAAHGGVFAANGDDVKETRSNEIGRQATKQVQANIEFLVGDTSLSLPAWCDSPVSTEQNWRWKGWVSCVPKVVLKAEAAFEYMDAPGGASGGEP